MRVTEEMTDIIADTERIIAIPLPCPSFNSALIVARISIGMIDVVVSLDIVIVYGVYY